MTYRLHCQVTISCLLMFLGATARAELVTQLIRPRVVEDLSPVSISTSEFASVRITQSLEIPKVDPSSFVLHSITGRLTTGGLAHSSSFGVTVNFHKVRGRIVADNSNIFDVTFGTGVGVGDWTRVEGSDGLPGGISSGTRIDTALTDSSGSLDVNHFIQDHESSTRKILIDVEAAAFMQFQAAAANEAFAAVMAPELEFLYTLEKIGLKDSIDWLGQPFDTVLSSGNLNDPILTDLQGEIPDEISTHLVNITSVPEPSVSMLAPAILSCLLIGSRRRRKSPPV